MRSKCKSPHAVLLVVLSLMGSAPPSFACQIAIPKREPTVAEQMAGLTTIFGGTVIGWETESGEILIGAMPAACVDEEFGGYNWESASTPACAAYKSVAAALFRVDTPIVGPEAGAIIPVYMTWGEGDCNVDFEVGETWFIAGFEYDGNIQSDLLSHAAQQKLVEPIRPDEIVALRKMAAEDKFDFDTLFQ